MAKKLLVISALLFGFLLTGCAGDTTSPKVNSTNPRNGAQNIDPTLSEIWVQFNEPMKDQSWSWAYANEDEFPKLSGNPYYTDNYTKNILPVNLEPNKEYVIWINSENLKNFKDKAGNPSEPYKFEFKTK